MGGRRATSISDVLGPKKSYPSLEKKLHRALSEKDLKGISTAAATLATKSVPLTDLDSYLVHLVPFIRKQLTKKEPPKDVRRDVRREWARIKKSEGIQVRPVVSNAVVQAAIDLLKDKP